MKLSDGFETINVVHVLMSFVQLKLLNLFTTCQCS